MSTDTRKIVYFDKDGKLPHINDSIIWIGNKRITNQQSIHNKAKVIAHKLCNLSANIAGYRIHTGEFFSGNDTYSKPIYFYNSNPEWMPTLDTTWD